MSAISNNHHVTNINEWKKIHNSRISNLNNDVQKNKISMIWRIAIAAIVIAATTAGIISAFVFAPITVPIAVFASIFAGVITTSISGYLIHSSINNYIDSKKQNESYNNETFSSLLKNVNCEFSKKIEMFRKHGMECKSLRLPGFYPGISVSAFIQWAVANKKLHSDTKKFLSDLVGGDYLKNKISLISLNCSIDRLNAYMKFVSSNNQQTNESCEIEKIKLLIEPKKQEIIALISKKDEDVIDPKDLIEIIENCPNLQTIYLQWFDDNKDIQRLCASKKIARRDSGLKYLEDIMQDFPGFSP